MIVGSSERQHPTIAIVGRPNVGKSTLFNRLIGRRKAVVSSLRGTTRDLLYGKAEWRDASLTLIDAGGVEFTKSEGLAGAVQRHIRRSLQEADGFLFVCDAHDGLLPADSMIMEDLRRTGKPVFLVVNKADQRPVVPPEFFALGITEAFAVSALHGRGIGELLDHLREHFSTAQPRRAESTSPVTDRPAHRTLAVAIVGRQNVGKSSLLNALLREERAIVSEVPGTTRDAVDTQLTVNGEPVLLIDTAGLRHRRKVRNRIDLFAMARTHEAIRRCDVALVMLDATQGVTRDDRRMLAEVTGAGCGVVLLVNKWDLVKGPNERKFTDVVHRMFHSAAFAPVLAVSAKSGFHVPRTLMEARRVFRAMQRGLSEAECAALVQAAWASQPVPRYRGRAIRLQGARWLSGRPCRIEVTTTPVGWIPLPFQRHLLKALSSHPRLSGVPITLVVRRPGQPLPGRSPVLYGHSPATPPSS